MLKIKNRKLNLQMDNKTDLENDLLTFNKHENLCNVLLKKGNKSGMMNSKIENKLMKKGVKNPVIKKTIFYFFDEDQKNQSIVKTIEKSQLLKRKLVNKNHFVILIRQLMRNMIQINKT